MELRRAATLFAVMGAAALIGGWILPNSDLTPAFISSAYPARIWLQFVAWLTLRLLGLLALVGFALVAVWRRGHGPRFGGGLLIAAGFSLSAYVLVSMLNVHLPLESMPGPAPVLRMVGAALLITAGGLARAVPRDIEAPPRGAAWPSYVGIVALAGATVFALVSILRVLPSRGPVGWMFALQYTPMVASAVWALLWKWRDPEFSAGLFAGTGAGAILASHVEIVGFSFADYVQGIGGALALLGGVLLAVQARGMRRDSEVAETPSGEVGVHGERRWAVQPPSERS